MSDDGRQESQERRRSRSRSRDRSVQHNDRHGDRDEQSQNGDNGEPEKEVFNLYITNLSFQVQRKQPSIVSTNISNACIS